MGPDDPSSQGCCSCQSDGSIGPDSTSLVVGRLWLGWRVKIGAWKIGGSKIGLTICAWIGACPRMMLVLRQTCRGDQFLSGRTRVHVHDADVLDDGPFRCVSVAVQPTVPCWALDVR
jgi:hypothetical protein